MEDRKRSPHRPRRFAPLHPHEAVAAKELGLPKLKGIIFDVDGTLCEPQNYMFAEMRSALGISKSVDILDHIYALPTPEEQQIAHEKIRFIERRAMLLQKPQVGLLNLMRYLDERKVRKGICTRNFDTPVNHLIDNFLQGHLFQPVITREFRPPKPDPAGILHIASEWGLSDGSNLIMVGDSVDDMTAGYKAGAATVLLVNEVNAHLADHQHTDLVIRRLDDLVEVLEKGFVGKVGQGEEKVDLQKMVEES